MNAMILLAMGVVLILENIAIHPSAINKTVGEQYEIKKSAREENGDPKRENTNWMPNEIAKPAAMHIILFEVESLWSIFSFLIIAPSIYRRINQIVL